MPEITKLLPDTIETYWEPFLGGGALFFALDGQIRDARLSDVNAELVLTCQTVRNKLGALLPRLQEHKDAHADKKYYYAGPQGNRLSRPLWRPRRGSST